jgi:hypothetical protein
MRAAPLHGLQRMSASIAPACDRNVEQQLLLSLHSLAMRRTERARSLCLVRRRALACISDAVRAWGIHQT